MRLSAHNYLNFKFSKLWRWVESRSASIWPANILITSGRSSGRKNCINVVCFRCDRWKLLPSTVNTVSTAPARWKLCFLLVKSSPGLNFWCRFYFLLLPLLITELNAEIRKMEGQGPNGCQWVRYENISFGSVESDTILLGESFRLGFEGRWKWNLKCPTRDVRAGRWDLQLPKLWLQKFLIYLNK